LPRTGKKDKRTGIEEKLNVISWNVRGLNNKENELEEELKKIKANVAFISETNKKSKGTKDLHHHILLYCNEFAGSISRWNFITLKNQYTTVDCSSQRF
jgi:exonuclease III